jgi:hypothetical protein
MELISGLGEFAVRRVAVVSDRGYRGIHIPSRSRNGSQSRRYSGALLKL